MAIAASPTMAPPPHLAPYSRHAQVGGLRLHYYDAGGGGGLPLVLVHGLGDDADSWRRVLPALASQRRVIAPDLPGFGRSAKPRRAYTSSFFARSIVALLDELGVERATLVGSSLGAAVAQRMALVQPARVARLVLVDGGLRVAPTLPPRPLWGFLAPGQGERAYTSLRASPEAAYATLAPYYADIAGLPPEEQAFLRERVWARVWDDAQRDAFLAALRCLAVERLLLAPVFRWRLARLPTPTTIVWGDADRIVAYDEAEALARLLPDARLHRIAGCGHLPQQERPTELVALITGADATRDDL